MEQRKCRERNIVRVEDEGDRLTVNMENALINNNERRSWKWITSPRKLFNVMIQVQECII
jgi:hypothetical protein